MNRPMFRFQPPNDFLYRLISVSYSMAGKSRLKARTSLRLTSQAQSSFLFLASYKLHYSQAPWWTIARSTATCTSTSDLCLKAPQRCASDCILGKGAPEIRSMSSDQTNTSYPCSCRNHCRGR